MPRKLPDIRVRVASDDEALDYKLLLSELAEFQGVLESFRTFFISWFGKLTVERS